MAKEKNTAKKKTKKKLTKKAKRFRLIASLVVIILILAAIIIVPKLNGPGPKKITTKSTLEKMIDIKELNTYKVIYNGVVKVKNNKDAKKVDYYVSYNSTVKAGIDLEKVTVDVNEADKVITVTLPKVTINDISVERESLDFIFVGMKDNGKIGDEAYKKCIDDVTRESKNEEALYTLAKENAKNTIENITKPFVEGYKLVVE